MSTEREALIARLDREMNAGWNDTRLFADLRAALAAAPVGEPVKWWNGCNSTVPEALRFLANNERPTGGEQRFNAEHLLQLAGEIERMARQPLYATPQPASAPVGGAAPETLDDIPKRLMDAARRDALTAADRVAIGRAIVRIQQLPLERHHDIQN